MWALISLFNEYIPLWFQIVITLEHLFSTAVSARESPFTHTRLFLTEPSCSSDFTLVVK